MAVKGEHWSGDVSGDIDHRLVLRPLSPGSVIRGANANWNRRLMAGEPHAPADSRLTKPMGFSHASYCSNIVTPARLE